MRRPGEIVDPTGQRQQRRRRNFLRVVLPLLVVGTVIVAILLIALHSYRVNRGGALKLSREVLQALQETVAEKVSGYLLPAVRSTTIVNDMLSHTDAADRHVAFDAFALSMLRETAQIEAFYLANADGEFFVLRRARTGGFVTRWIHDGGPNAPGRNVTIQRLDEDGRVTAEHADPSDDYDPRQRRWFEGAVATPGRPFWSHPYLLKPIGKPVITVSMSRRGSNGTEHVAAVDVALDSLSAFTADLKVGTSGHAVILDAAGHLVAAPQLARSGVDPATTELDAASDPVMAGAWDRYRVLGFGARQVISNGIGYVTIAAPLPQAAPGWVLLLAAPESDFSGFAVVSGRQNLLFSLVIVLLAGALAALAVRQGLRADRTGRLLAETRERAREDTAAIATLIEQPGLFDPSAEAPLLTERLADIAGARRAGIWILSSDGRTLRCEDRFDRDERGHVGGYSLTRDEMPRFLDAIGAGQSFEVDDARGDGRTSEFQRLAMREGGSRAAAIVPIEGDGAAIGAVVLEDATAIGRARNVARAVAGIVAIRVRAAREHGEVEQDAAPTPERRQPEDPAAASGTASFVDDAAAGRIAPDQVEGMAIYPACAVLHLTFADPLVASNREAAEVVRVADRIALGVQEIGRRFELPYLKILNHSIVAACGCAPEADPAAAVRLADAAIAIRELCLEAMESVGLDAYFQIGADVGRAVGRALGDAPAVFNLWGDAIRMAELMAASAADPGTIQVTEQAYQVLRSRFLFRERGRFYMPRVGVARSFVLAGRR